MFPALQAGTLPPEHRNTFPSNENHIFQSATNISITSQSTSYFSFNSEGKGWLPTGVPITTNTQNRGACASQHRFSQLKVSHAKLKSAEMFCRLHLCWMRREAPSCRSASRSLPPCWLPRARCAAPTCTTLRSEKERFAPNEGESHTLVREVFALGSPSPHQCGCLSL